ncbi:MAG: tRNA dihydrouridine synthase DusB [Oscillospiraceae bacterium]|nr:tRNA dihydrouridine synthase DusB [Oscillospiraceae bacterium]
MRVALAPMAGVTDWAFRTICKETADVQTTTEMVSAKALCYQDKKSLGLLRLVSKDETVQIFGSDPGCMAEGALRALDISGAAEININMGCPTPKIVKNGDGCALMQTPDLAEAIAKAVVGAVKVPVTVKMRLGWDSGSKNAAELAKRLEGAGVSGLCVHGRTRKQMYSGHADWYAIAEVVKAVSVPITANGDIFSLRDLERCLNITGAAAGMIGRAAMGNPFVFTGEEPAVARRLEKAGRHFGLLTEDKGERVACLEMRKHLGWYIRGFHCASYYKREISSIATAADFDRCIKRLREERDGTV